MDISSLLVEWWFGQTPKPNKDDFLQHRTEWEQTRDFVHNKCGSLLSHNEIKKKISNLDKAGVLGACSFDAAIGRLKTRNTNRKTWNHSKGPDGIVAAIERLAKGTAPKRSEEYNKYKQSKLWRERRQAYLHAHCFVDGKYVCQVCGRQHDQGAGTIQVHCNNYAFCNLDGQEPDHSLIAVCATPCHNAADVLRRLRSGSICKEEMMLNDAGRSLFRTFSWLP